MTTDSSVKSAAFQRYNHVNGGYCLVDVVWTALSSLRWPKVKAISKNIEAHAVGGIDFNAMNLQPLAVPD